VDNLLELYRQQNQLLKRSLELFKLLQDWEPPTKNQGITSSVGTMNSSKRFKCVSPSLKQKKPRSRKATGLTTLTGGRKSP
jgi:hypothetical protein